MVVRSGHFASSPPALPKPQPQMKAPASHGRPPPTPGWRLPPPPSPCAALGRRGGRGPRRAGICQGKGSQSEGLNRTQQPLLGGLGKVGWSEPRRALSSPKVPKASGCPAGGGGPAHRGQGRGGVAAGPASGPPSQAAACRVPPQRLCCWEEGGLAGPRASPGLSLECKAMR